MGRLVNLMRNGKFILFLVLTAALISGCTKKTPEETEPQETEPPVSIEEQLDVSAFTGNPDASYHLYINGEKVDVTKYVYSCSQNEAVFRSGILSLLGFIPYERGEETGEEPQTIAAVKDYQYREYLSPEGKLLQCRIGGDTVFYGEDSMTLPQKIELIDGGDEFTLPVSAFLVMGYNEIETSRDGNSLVFRLIK